MKRDKKSQAGIISVVLLILLVLAASVIIANVVLGFTREKSGEIGIDALKIRLDVKNIEIKGSDVTVKVHRGTGGGKIDSLKFIVYFDNGLTEVKEITNNMLEEFETKDYILNLDNKVNTVMKVDVIPFIGGKAGIPLSSSEGDLGNLDFITNGNVEKGTTEGWNGADGVSNNAHSGVYSLIRSGNSSNPYGQIDNSILFPVDLDKTYYEEGWFKSIGSAGNSLMYLGFIPYDSQMKWINPASVYYQPGSENVLTEPCNSEDKIVKIKNCNNWVQSYTWEFMAFNVDDSGAYSDLPNFDLSNMDIVRIEDKGGYCEIEFATKVGINASANTKVREHFAGGTFMYNAATNVAVPGEWTKYSAKLKGWAVGYESFGDANNPGTWRRGTKYARLIILTNTPDTDSPGYTLLMDDLKVTVI